MPSNGITAPMVHVVIPVHNGGNHLAACLQSLLASTLPAARVIVVDDASTDGAVDGTLSRFPDMDVVRNDKNVGFGATCNRGIQQALEHGADYVFLLNQDATVAPDMLARLVACGDEHAGAGCIAPKTLATAPLPDGRQRLLYAGAWRQWLPLGQRVPGAGRADRADGGGPFEVDYVWGHGMLLRSAALREVGLFDPGFFMYYEDIDLCLRLRDAGWQIWCEPRAVMWHDMPDGARAADSERWRWQCKVRSIAYLHRKRFSQGKAVFLTLATVAAEMFARLRSGHPRAVCHLLSSLGECLHRPPHHRRPMTVAANARRRWV